MREVINPLKVWDAARRQPVLLPPGTILTACRIHREANEYKMEFESNGGQYHCPLWQFQPRTQPIDPPQPASF
jgi:hypothetical protein